METAFETKPCVLVVDDTPDNLTLMGAILSEQYRVKATTDGRKAIQIVESDDRPDLILLDIMMPNLDGYEVCRILKTGARTAPIPVIFLTSKTDVEDEKKGLELGAVDYIAKPVSPPILLARVKTHLQLKSARDFLQDKNEYLEQEVLRRTHEVQVIQDVTITALGSLAETRDNDTGNHIRRTQHFMKILASRVSGNAHFKSFLDAATIELLYKSAPLHDIGKVGIPDNILLKPGKLTPEEFEVMKTHTTLGRDAILAAEKLLETPTSFLNYAREIAWCHHEKWDGSGYPRGLVGEAIPVAGRLMAVVDVYDALISKRVYKPAFPHEEAVSIIESGSGTHFDPEIVDTFLDISDQLWSIAQRYLDR
jgi:putative two-component system response regulator